MASRDQQYAELERDNHRLRVELQRVRDERDQSRRQAATWRRVAQFVWEASRDT